MYVRERSKLLFYANQYRRKLKIATAEQSITELEESAGENPNKLVWLDVDKRELDYFKEALAK